MPIERHLMVDLASTPGRRVVPATQCRACGAKLRRKVFALCCRSCGEFLVQDSDLTERARPDGLVPFEIDEAAARAAFAEWVSSRRFSPNSLRDGGGREASTVDGVFLPVWWFSSNTVTDYTGQRGSSAFRSVGGSIRSYIAWRKVAGRVGRYFAHLLIPACTPLVTRLPEWRLEQLVPYVQGSSRGRRIIAYDVEPEEGFEQARVLMSSQITRDVKADIGGTDQRVKHTGTTFTYAVYSLLLVPAWLVTYSHGGRTWSALVNGASGQVVGDRPYSAAKISLSAASLLASAAGVVALLHYR